jgi:CysZ protein
VSSPTRSLGGAALGVRLLFEGMGLLRRHRSLWMPSSAPVAFSLASLAIALGLVVHFAADLHALATAWMPVLEAGAWYSWLWIGPAKLALAALGYALFLLAVGLAMLAALLLASVLSAPFLDLLSRRVEQIAAGRAPESDDSSLRTLLRDGRSAAWNELQRVLFFLAVWGVLLLVGVLVPGGQLVSPPALILFTLLFLPLDYAGYSLDRRRVPFRVRRRWVLQNLPSMAGLGGAAFATSLVPGLNFLLIPLLVTAGTLLVLRIPPEPGGG